jgi:hypothetical protein
MQGPRRAAQKDCLGLRRFPETIGEAFRYHPRRSRAALEVGWLGKSGTALESFAITILLGFADCFTLRVNDDDRPFRIAVTGHLQKTIVTIVFSRKLDVEEISIWECSYRPGYNNYVLSEARHFLIFLLPERPALQHIMTVL